MLGPTLGFSAVVRPNLGFSAAFSTMVGPNLGFLAAFSAVVGSVRGREAITLKKLKKERKRREIDRDEDTML